MRLDFCVACGSKEKSLEHHHLLPRGDGGSDDDANLITLCHECHGKIHGMVRRDMTGLVKAGIERAKARGVKFGAMGALNLKNLCPTKQSENRTKGNTVKKRKADSFAESVYPLILSLRLEGKSVKQVSDYFNNEGIPTYSGKGRWSKSQVYRYICRLDSKEKGPEGPLT